MFNVGITSFCGKRLVILHLYQQYKLDWPATAEALIYGNVPATA